MTPRDATRVNRTIVQGRFRSTANLRIDYIAHITDMQGSATPYRCAVNTSSQIRNASPFVLFLKRYASTLGFFIRWHVQCFTHGADDMHDLYDIFSRHDLDRSGRIDF